MRALVLRNQAAVTAKLRREIAERGPVDCFEAVQDWERAVIRRVWSKHMSGDGERGGIDTCRQVDLEMKYKLMHRFDRGTEAIARDMWLSAQCGTPRNAWASGTYKHVRDKLYPLVAAVVVLAPRMLSPSPVRSLWQRARARVRSWLPGGG